MEKSEHFYCKNCGKTRGEHRAYTYYCPLKSNNNGLLFSNKTKYQADTSKTPKVKIVI